MVPEQLVSKAKDFVDYFVKRKPLDKPEITHNIVANMVELSDSALSKLAKKNQIDSPRTSQRYNMRFIKPNKTFYDILMSVWMSQDPSHLNELSFEKYA